MGQSQAPWPFPALTSPAKDNRAGARGDTYPSLAATHPPAPRRGEGKRLYPGEDILLSILCGEDHAGSRDAQRGLGMPAGQGTAPCRHGEPGAILAPHEKQQETLAEL